MGGSSVAAVPWGWVWDLQGVPSAGLPSVGIDGCGWVPCLGMLVLLSLGKGPASASTLAENTSLNVLLLLPVVHAAQPSLLCLGLSFPGLSQIMREAPDETMA